jgi:excisionase family DNA binding protein
MTTRDDDLLTIAEATRLLKIGRTTLHRWLKAGRLRAYQVGPKAVRIRRRDLQAVMKPVHGGDAGDVKEVQPTPAQAIIRPWTDEEVERGLAALARSQEHTTRMLAERGGMPFAPSWPLIREAREERSEQV